MRTLILVISLLLVPPAFAGDRNPPLDALYGCLVGHGAIEMNYDADAGSALAVAEKACQSEIDAANRAPASGEMDDNAGAVEDAALSALAKLA